MTTPRTFGLPVRGRLWAWAAAAAVLAYDVATMSRDLSFYDSAELAMVAAQGGLGHPVGQPLHTLLGWLAAGALPTLWALNLLSAVPTALMVVPLTSLAERMAPDAPRWVAPAVLAALLVHPVFWENGSRVEVYALAGFLAVWAVARMADALERGRGWFLAGLALGLCAAANPYTAIIAAVAAGPALLWALVKGRIGLRGVIGALLGGPVGMLPYVYVPLVAGRDQVFVWGQPIDGPSVRFYFSGADFGHNRSATAGLVLDHVVDWLGYAADAGLLPLLVVGGGAALLLGRDLQVGRAYGLIAAGLTVLLLASNAIFHPAIPDYAGYLAPPFGVLAACVAGLVARLAAGEERLPLLGAAMGAAVILAGWLAPPVIWARTRHLDTLARDMAEGVLQTAPADAIVVVESDHWVWPLLYLQAVEGQRPDVTVFAFGLADSSWYWAWTYRNHPKLEPFPLRGPGGRLGRGRRFLAANQHHAPLYENFGLSVVLGRPGCVGPWLVTDARACTEIDPTDAADAVLAHHVEVLGDGSPASEAVAARVAFDRADALWRLGHPARAFAALRAGVPDALEPAAPAAVASAGRLDAPPLAFAGGPPIGAAGQNLFLGSQLLWRAGHADAARAWLAAAAEAGVREALSE
ncbi:MAG: DUF2723 domain-containing protein [Myxococcales bacterium]|nr:DUF2723 domain-containing protein [Myxococcales bacterium]